MDSTSSSTYSPTSFNGDLESLSEEDYFRYVGQYDCPCIGSTYGCPAMTNGSQYCYKYYCPYEDKANQNDVFIEETKEEVKKEVKEEVKKEIKNKRNKKVKSHSI